VFVHCVALTYHCLSQLSKVQLHAEHVKAARRAIERETIVRSPFCVVAPVVMPSRLDCLTGRCVRSQADAEGILHRLRSAEAFKLSLLQHDIDELSVR